MAFQQVEYEFPDPDKEDKDSLEIELEPTSAEPMQKPKKAKAEYDDNDVEIIEDDDIELEVVDDTPKADRGKKPAPPPEEVTDEELSDYSRKVRKRIQQISKGYHDERRAKEAILREKQELENLAQKLMDENKKLQQNTNKSQVALLEQAKRNVKAELDAAKAKYRQAYEAGEAEGVLEAQEALTNARLKAERLDNIKLPPLQEKEVPVETRQQEPINNAPAPQVDTKAKEWQEANPWFGADDEMTAYALGLHSKLVKNGVDPQSDEYYETINSRMRSVFPDNFEGSHELEGLEEETEQPVERPQRSTNVVAPATRSTAPKKVRLTRTQVALAKRLGLTPKQYADQVALLRKTNG